MEEDHSLASNGVAFGVDAASASPDLASLLLPALEPGLAAAPSAAAAADGAMLNAEHESGAAAVAITRCEDCEKECGSVYHYGKHVEGKDHAKRVQSNERARAVAAPGKVNPALLKPLRKTASAPGPKINILSFFSGAASSAGGASAAASSATFALAGAGDAAGAGNDAHRGDDGGDDGGDSSSEGSATVAAGAESSRGASAAAAVRRCGGEAGGFALHSIYPSPFAEHFSMTAIAREPKLAQLRVTLAGIASSMHCTGEVGSYTDRKGDVRPLTFPDLVGGGPACRPCCDLASNMLLTHTMPRRAIDDVGGGGMQRQLWTPHQYGMQLDAVLAARDALRKESYNTSVALLRAKKKNALYHDILVAIADNDITRASRLLYVALHCKPPKSARAIFRLVSAAAVGAYRVKSYTSSERDVMLLVYRLGRRSLTFAVAKALGMPAISATLRRVKEVSGKIIVTAASSRAATDMRSNISSQLLRLRETGVLPSHGTIFGAAVDETAVRLLVDADPKHGVVGLCACCKTAYQFDSFEHLIKVKEDLLSGAIHIAKNVLLIVLVDFVGYIGRPVVIFAQGCCSLAATEQCDLLDLTAHVWRSPHDGGPSFEERYGPLIQMGHDGTSSQRLADEMRFFPPTATGSAPLSPVPPLPAYFAATYDKLRSFVGFDARFAHDGMGGGADVKHALKRFLQHLSGPAAGLQIANVFVPVAILRQYVSVALRLPIDHTTIDAIFKSGDKMRVPPAITACAAFGSYRYTHTISFER